MMGVMHERGLGGLVSADSAIVRWVERAAKHGDGDAQYALALYYARAQHGLRKDEQLVALWMRRAAEQLHRDAQYELGRMYELGRNGLAKDKSLALGQYRRAARQGQGESAGQTTRAARNLARLAAAPVVDDY